MWRLRCLRHELSWWIERDGRWGDWWCWKIRNRWGRVIDRSEMLWPTQERAQFAVERLRERIAETPIEVVEQP